MASSSPQRPSEERNSISSNDRIDDDDYARLLEFRTGLRTFLKWSKNRAGQAGLAPSQHQLLLAIRGHKGGAPSIGDVSQYLLVKPHSAAELVARAEKAGLVRRDADERDGRVVRLALTPLGSRKLAAITAATLEELDRLGPTLRRIWKGLDAE
jgi:DNA-binding MarR family transcriptional regulator